MMKTALVTGASRGVGLNLVRALRRISVKGALAHYGWGQVKELVAVGYAVVATCRAPASATGLKQLQAELHEQQNADRGRLLGVVALDVTDEQSVASALVKVRDELGLASLDVLINNAGVATDKHPYETVMEATAKGMQEVFATNVVGPLLVMQAFYPLLLASSSSPSSSLAKVINISSRMGSISLYQDSHSREAWPSASYRVSKAAQNMLTKCFAVEHPDECIFLAVHPGHVQTDMGTTRGRSPPVTPEQSAQGIVRVLQGLTKDDNGSFFNYDGARLAW